MWCSRAPHCTSARGWPDTPICGICSGTAPHSASSPASHEVQSNNGYAVAATVVDTIGLPLNALFATACAIQ